MQRIFMQRTSIVLAASLAFLASVCFAKPPTRQEAERQSRVVELLKEAVAAETTEEAKFAAISAVLAREFDVDVRRRVLDIAVDIPGTAQEAFLIDLLTTEGDAGLRSQAATALGRSGSQQCLAALAKAATSDRTTGMQIGDVRG